MSFPKNPNVKFSYFPNTKAYSEKSQQQTEVNSLSRTSFTSFSHSTSRPISQLGVVHRANQLKPTKKVTIIHKHKQIEPQRVFETQYQQEQIRTSMNYQAIKPTFGLGKYINLCGMENGEGKEGCKCFRQPCKYSLEWTKNCSPKNKKLYINLLSQKLDTKTCEQIEKDLPRTYPDCPTYSMNYHFRSMLGNMLRVYSIYDLQAGYVQGMNMVAAVILYHIKKQQQAFWAFVDLMDQRELRLIYLSGFSALKSHCFNITNLIQQKIYDLHIFMAELGISPQVFLYGWLLSLMSNCIPLQYMHLLIDKFRLEGWAFIYRIVIAYLLFIKEALLTATDTAEFLIQVNSTNSKDHGIHWQQMIQNCHKIHL